MKPEFLSLRATHGHFSKVRLRKDVLHVSETSNSDISVAVTATATKGQWHC